MAFICILTKFCLKESLFNKFYYLSLSIIYLSYHLCIFVVLFSSCSSTAELQERGTYSEKNHHPTHILPVARDMGR